MPLYLGTTEKEVYLGSVRKKVYLGDTLIADTAAPTPGAPVYNGLVSAGAGVVLGTVGPGRSSFPNRVMWDPVNDTVANRLGTVISSHVPDGFPSMPRAMTRRESGNHNGRITFSITSGAVNPAEFMYAQDRYMYLITIDTYTSGSDTEHEWICVKTNNPTSQSALGGSSWINLYPGINTSNQPDRADNLNVREDLVAGRLAGTDRTASILTATAYNTWIAARIRREAGEGEIEFLIAFSNSATFNPNA